MGHFSKKSADINPLLSLCDRIPIPYYNAEKAMFIYIRQNEDYPLTFPCSVFSCVSKSQVYLS